MFPLALKNCAKNKKNDEQRRSNRTGTLLLTIVGSGCDRAGFPPHSLENREMTHHLMSNKIVGVASPIGQLFWTTKNGIAKPHLQPLQPNHRFPDIDCARKIYGYHRRLSAINQHANPCSGAQETGALIARAFWKDEHGITCLQSLCPGQKCAAVSTASINGHRVQPVNQLSQQRNRK